MRKRSVTGILLSVMILSLSACGSTEIVPEKHLDTISEYAAIKLLKYDANNRSRLVDAATIEEADRRQEEWDKAGAVQPTPTPTPEGMDPVDEDIPIIGDKENVEATCSSLEQYFDTPEGIGLQYSSYDICESYSQNPGDSIVLEASQGNKLLVMKFKLTNTSASDITVDLFAKKARYRIIINGDTVSSAMRTLLMNDMSTYVSSLAGNAEEEIVLVTEVSNESVSSLSSIDLHMKNEDKIYTISIL